MIPSLSELAEQLARLGPAISPSSPVDAAGSATGSNGAPATPAASPSAAQVVDYAVRGCHLEACVEPGQVTEAARILDQNGFSLDTITGVDWIAQDQMEVIYDYFHFRGNCRVAVRTRVPRSNPEVPTIHEVFPCANWHERETYEFFGIRFLGHPNLVPLLLPEDSTSYPLRKDFVA